MRTVADQVALAMQRIQSRQTLRNARPLFPGAEQPLDLLVVLQATFADSTMVMALAEVVEAPLLLWAVPEERSGGRLRLNSFCGINLGAHALRRGGRNNRLQRI